jgi:hypothetical protein
MRKLFKPLFAIAAAGCLVASCTNEDMTENKAELSQETLSKISALGFSVADVQVVDGNYV